MNKLGNMHAQCCCPFQLAYLTDTTTHGHVTIITLAAMHYAQQMQVQYGIVNCPKLTSLIS